MQVTIDSRTLKEFLQKSLEPRISNEKKLPDSSVNPVEPQDELRRQVSFDEPNVHDEEYKPTSHEDLSRAAYALSKDVPSDKIDLFYTNLKSLVTTSSEKEPEMDKVTEHKLRNAIQKSLFEAYGDTGKRGKSEKPFDDAAQAAWDEKRKRRRDALGRKDDDFRHLEKQVAASDLPGWKKRGETDLPQFMDDTDVVHDPDDDNVVDLDVSRRNGRGGTELPWEEIAAQSGYAGPPGARQAAAKAAKKAGVMMKHPEEVDEFKWEALVDYVNELIQEDAIDEEEADVLLQNPEITYELDSYRMFLQKYVNRFMKAHEGDPQEVDPDVR